MIPYEKQRKNHTYLMLQSPKYFYLNTYELYDSPY